jgi:hypothetical protein
MRLRKEVRVRIHCSAADIWFGLDARTRIQTQSPREASRARPGGHDVEVAVGKTIEMGTSRGMCTMEEGLKKRTGGKTKV